MTRQLHRPLAAALLSWPLAFSSVALRPAVAWAQVGIGGAPTGSGGGGGGAAAKDDDDDKPKPAPPSLPGAVSRSDQVAPAPKNAGDLDPNAALFDAIDRGDIAAARDALSRGADLGARDVLGQTPLDMSIDLNRNDITFLLMSMRSQDGDEAPAAPPGGGGIGGGSVGGGNGGDLAAPPPDDTETASVTPAPGGGTPVPNRGFLGFGH